MEPVSPEAALDSLSKPAFALEVLARMPATVRAVMTHDLIAVSPEHLVFDAVQRFADCGVRHMLVLDDTGRLAGVLSDRDALRAMARGSRADEIRVAAIMTRDAAVAQPEMPLMDAIDVMVFHRIHCLPVLEPTGRVVGIVTTTDLLAAFHALLDRARLRSLP